MDLSVLDNKLKRLKNKTNKKDLAVVCCYFNPCSYKSKLKNYEIFRAGIISAGVRFLTVELAFGNNNFELNKFSEVIHLRTAKKNVMWQKERLLNIGIMQLIDEGYKKIAWLDTDVIFEDKNWVRKLSRTLEKYPLCQVFKGANINKDKKNKVFLKSFVENICKRRVRSKDYFPSDLDWKDSTTGFGWVARSDILRKVSLYDGSILGGGDILIFLAAYSRESSWLTNIKKLHIIELMPRSFLNHYIAWAEKWGALILGNVGFIEQNIKTLYHGELKSRNYKEREKILLEHDFNPEKDIKLDDNLCFEWNSEKLKLHQEVNKYFYLRKEDD